MRRRQEFRRSRPRNGRSACVATLCLVSVFAGGCASSGLRAEYTPKIEDPKAVTVWSECEMMVDGEMVKEPCILVPLQHYEDVRSELSACCVALGHSAKKCTGP